ncbi:MAG: DUF393 domain-containing protein [Flavobacteriaceae bacterium]|nr:DUF393 domain-containing protein [Flavobacteriaceae bacterium]
MDPIPKKSIILFDGLCSLCNSSVQFILKHEKNQNFLFASLQSDAAAKILLQLNYKKNDLNSLVLIEEKHIYTKSTAALKIIKSMKPLWSWFYIMIIVPKFIRDFMYDLIAKNRYQWFGKLNICELGIDKNKDRFIKNR